MEEKLLRLPQVKENTGIKTSTVYAKIKALKFPQQYKYGRTACWKKSEIQLYIDIGEEAYHQMLLDET
jgi:predicted DNA-binding transcriptional regulator AlpA